MYSKCGVAPRMTQPRQTTASNRPVSARDRAACGSSNAPGTLTTSTSSSRAPASSERRTGAVAQRLGDRVVEPRDRRSRSESRRRRSGGAVSLLSLRTLFPLELGLALLEKRARALAHVVGARDQPEQRRLEALPSADDICSPLLTASMM